VPWPDSGPSWCPHRSCSRHRSFVNQKEKRDLISRALCTQIPNPGFVSRCAGRDIFGFSPRVGAVGGKLGNRKTSNTSQHQQPRHEAPRPAEGGQLLVLRFIRFCQSIFTLSVFFGFLRVSADIRRGGKGVRTSEVPRGARCMHRQ
jgi:hypothetical protein